MAPAHKRFTDMLLALLQDRTGRYGTANIQGQPHVYERAKDKMARLEKALYEGGMPTAADWEDLAGYAAIGWLLETGQWDQRSALRRVYLAHPIPEATEIGTLVRGWLTDNRLSVYWPRGAFHMAQGQDAWIWEVNLRAIKLCDMVLALMPKTTPGTSAEIFHGKMLGKVVWVYWPHEEISSLVGWAASRIFGSLEELSGALREVGHHAADRD